jgi:hypothetical protein
MDKKNVPIPFRVSYHPRIVEADESRKVIRAQFGDYKAEREFCGRYNATHLVAAVQSSEEAAVEYLQSCIKFERCGSEVFERAILAAAKMGEAPALLFMELASTFSVVMAPFSFTKTLAHLVSMNASCADFFLKHEHNFRERPGYKEAMQAIRWRRGCETQEDLFRRALLKIRDYAKKIISFA